MDAIRFVLVRPEQAGNVGAAARALKNMGLNALWLVSPRLDDDAHARRLAHGAVDVLEGAQCVDSLAEAVGDCRWVVGATRRRGRHRLAEWTARELAAGARTDAERRPLAIVFGPESDGLSSDDLARCHDLVWIPAAGAQPSLNLAQAVLVVAYELFMAGAIDDTAAAATAAATEVCSEDLAALYAHVESMLVTVGFARAETAPARMVAIRRLLGRARLRPDEVQLLRGVCRQAEWAATRGRAV